MTLNRKNTAENRHQGQYKKVLCVCSAGCLRSPTAAVVLSQDPFNFNTRACGIDTVFAIIPLDEVLLHWADEIVCMDIYQEKCLKEMTDKPIKCLNISDSYNYRDPELVKQVKEKYLALEGLK